MTQTKEESCPTCGKRIASERGGSITQWIFGTECCLCNKKPIQAQSKSETTFCRKCGLPLAAREGTFTQWIFRSETCRCDAPQQTDAAFDVASKIGSGTSASNVSSVSDASTLDAAPGIKSEPGHSLFSGTIEIFVNRYEVQDHLGSGATSSVDKAIDVLLNKTVALKRLHKSRLSAEQVQRFQLEAKILGGLRHPNLVCVLDCGVTDDNQPYLVMECEDGTVLEKLLESGALPMETAVSVATQICNAMTYVHKQGVIHRDLNPRNVMLMNAQAANPIVKILDFGVARFDRPEGINLELTQPGQIVGNPLCMSPEQARGRELDGRSDIYSLGCLLFYMLSGFPPYRGNSLMEIVLQQTGAPVVHLKESAEPLALDRQSSLAEAAWIELSRIVSTCMAKDPNDRLSSMSDVEAQLKNVKAPARSTHPIQNQRQTPANSRNRETITLACAVIAFALLTIGALTLLHPERTPKQPKPFDVPPAQDGIPPDTGKTIATLRRELAQHKTRIELSFSTLTPEYFEALSKAKQIQNLILSNCFGVTKDGLALLVENKVPVRDLILDGSDVDDEGLKQASKLNSLQVVRMRTCDGNITSDGIGSLATCPTLETLNCNDSKVDDAGVAQLVKSRLLNNLKMANTQITNQAARSLSQAKQFSTLDLSLTKVDDSGVKLLWNLPNLDTLHLRQLKITDAALTGFKGNKALKCLSFSYSKGITDGAFETLSRIPGLETLDLACTSVTPSSLAILSKMKSLRFLNIGGLSFSGADELELRTKLAPCFVTHDPKYNRDDH